MTATRLATLTWPVEPVPVIAHVGSDGVVEHGMRSLAALVAEVAHLVPARAAEEGWRVVGEPQWQVVSGEAAGLSSDAALRCVLEIEKHTEPERQA